MESGRTVGALSVGMLPHGQVESYPRCRSDHRLCTPFPEEIEDWAMNSSLKLEVTENQIEKEHSSKFSLIHRMIMIGCGRSPRRLIISYTTLVRLTRRIPPSMQPNSSIVNSNRFPSSTSERVHSLSCSFDSLMNHRSMGVFWEKGNRYHLPERTPDFQTIIT
jgi:hypothetical protein